MKFNYKTAITTTAFIALVTLFMASASLKTSHPTHSEVTIAYSSAELNSYIGKASIESQIRQAARQVCGSVILREAGSLKNARSNQSCYVSAVEDAMSSINGIAITSR